MTDKSCLTCKQWKDCIGKIWFTYSDIRWCPHQVIWIWQNRVELLDGHWPINSMEVPDHEWEPSISSEATYEKPEIVLAELEKRMETLPRDVKGAFKDAVNKEYLIENFSPPAYLGLMYLKGYNRKLQSFSQWRRGIKE